MSDDEDKEEQRDLGAIWVRVPFKVDEDGDTQADYSNLTLLGREMTPPDFYPISDNDWWVDNESYEFVDALHTQVVEESIKIRNGTSQLPYIEQ